MKKFFSKALSLVLTLALLATVFSFVGVTASAAKNISELVENNSKKVYFIDFTNASGGQKGEVIAYIPANYLPEGTCKDAEIEISYSYYLKSEHYAATRNEIYARNWPLGNNKDAADVPDDKTGFSFLEEGMGSFYATYTCPTDEFCYGVSKEKSTTPTNADLYIWDLKVYIDGELVDTNPIKDHQNKSANVDVSIVSYEEMFNAQKAWKCTFNNVANSKSGFALNSAFNCGSASIKIEFDYYYDSTSSYIYFKNATGENFDTVKHDGSVVDANLQLGTHHLVAESAGFASGKIIPIFQNGNTTLNGTLYIWNINLYANGVKRNDKITPLNSYTTANNATNGYIVEEGTYGELMATRKAYRLDYSKVAAAGKTAGWCFSGYAFGSNELVVSFNYKVVGAVVAEAIDPNDISGGKTIYATGGDSKDERFLIADGNEHYYEYVGTDLENDKLFFRLSLANPTLNTNVTVYVWNLIVRQTSEYHNRQNLMTNTFNGEANYMPLDNVECTYADVVAETPVMLLDFADAEAELGEKNEVLNAKYTLQRTAKKMEPGDNDADISIYFDYYLANAAADEIRVYNVAGGNMDDDKTGTDFLQPGRNTFSITGRKLSDFGVDSESLIGNLLTAVALANPNVDSNAKLYIWNLQLEMTYDTDSEKFGAYNAGIDGTPDKVGPEATMVEYTDVENKFDANNDGATNVLDLIRAKRVSLNPYLTYDKENLGYADLKAIDLVEIKLAILAK